ncbi:hypothetical protein GCM10020000_60900 [Streptomyces olivoverticillatus]
MHEGHDEYFYVLEGELTLHTGDGEVTARPGDLLAATRGTPHGFRNAGAVPARALCLYTPLRLRELLPRRPRRRERRGRSNRRAAGRIPQPLRDQLLPGPVGHA